MADPCHGWTEGEPKECDGSAWDRLPPAPRADTVACQPVGVQGPSAAVGLVQGTGCGLAAFEPRPYSEPEWRDATAVGSRYEVQVQTNGTGWRHRPLALGNFLARTFDQPSKPSIAFPWKPGNAPNDNGASISSWPAYGDSVT